MLRCVVGPSVRRAARTDAKHKEVARAFKLLGLAYLDTSGAGKGLEDYLVAMPERWADAELGANWCQSYWLFVEVKSIETESTGYVRYTKRQKEWRAKTAGWPRITVVSAEDAVRQLRERMGK